jgi:hypothetical protein
MTTRVAHVGTGNVGRLALRQLVTDPRFELVGLAVSTPAKVGRDAGELAGLDVVTGVTATDDLDAVIATEPEIVVYCAMGDTRPVEATRDVRRFLAAGIDVVASAPGSLQWPWGVVPDKVREGVEADCRAGGSSIFVTGVDPGFANDIVPLTLASTCQRVDAVRCYEFADYATYDGAEVMFDLMGFGQQDDETPLLFLPGVLTLAWATAIRQLAAGLGVEIDDIVESYEREPAAEAFDIAAGHIPAGGTAAVRFSIAGVRDGVPVVTVEHVTRLQEGQRPDWPTPAQPGGSYRVEIDGEPSYVVDIQPTSAYGDHNHAAIVAAAGRIVNAIPAVLAAEPGIRTALELPLVPPGQAQLDAVHATS